MSIRKILIADDDADIRLVGELCLRRIGGWEVVMASSGEEALDRARQEQPDVILLDVMMPNGDGPTALAKLREDPSTAALPVIFLTARVQKHEIESYRKLGADGVILKPFDATTLPDEIRHIVEARDAPQTDFADDLLRLRETYRKRLPGQLDELGARLRVAREGTPARERLETARDLAHRLKGTAGTYGFDEVGARLERIEEKLDGLLAGRATADTGFWGEIARALQAAQSHLGTAP
ncbi:MAG: response regulator [Myxococcota bacterium]